VCKQEGRVHVSAAARLIDPAARTIIPEAVCLGLSFCFKPSLHESIYLCLSLDMMG
jgi:hypothetical protein